MKAVTVQDINKYIAIIRVNFENAYKTQNDEERQLLVKTWYAILKEYPKEVCDAAVLNAIKHSAFWAGPFTPAIPLQIGLAYGLKKMAEGLRKLRRRKKGEEDERKNDK